MIGPFFILLKFFIHLIFKLFIFFFCNFCNKLLFSYKKILVALLNIGNFSNVLIKIFVKLPSPGPSSTMINYLGLPKVSQVDTNHIAIISENKFDIPGAVKKSPFFPKGIFDE